MQYLKEQEDNEEEFLNKENNNFHCSEAGRCLRFAFFERTNPLPNSDETKRIFMLGHIFHSFLQQNILKDYIIEHKFKMELPEFTISGMIDAHNDNEIIEIKTSSNLYYIQSPKEENIAQANLYLHYTNLPEARIIYLGKNDLQVKEFKIKYNKKLYNQTIQDFEYLHEKIKNKADPLEIKPKISVECYRCKYYNRCFSK